MIRRPPISPLSPYTTLSRSTAVDGDGRWYRVHPLFRAALRRELADPAAVAEVRHRAAAWFWERGLVEEARSEEHTSELQSRQYLVCRLLLEKKKRQA